LIVHWHVFKKNCSFNRLVQRNSISRLQVKLKIEVLFASLIPYFLRCSASKLNETRAFKVDHAGVPSQSKKKIDCKSKSFWHASTTEFPVRRELPLLERKRFPASLSRQFRSNSRKSSPRLRTVYTAVNQLIAPRRFFLLFLPPTRSASLPAKNFQDEEPPEEYVRHIDTDRASLPPLSAIVE